MEYNMSSFKGEMIELAYLTSNITPRTLAVLDELGRGTSHLEGLALAFATAEWLVTQSAFTLFVTHFPQLYMLSSMYNGVRCVHMRTAGGEGLRFIHKIGDGSSELQAGYGVQMARLCGFPTALVARAETLRHEVRIHHPLILTQAPPDTNEALAGQLLHFLTLMGTSSLTGAALRAALNALRARVQTSSEQVLLARLDEYNPSPTHVVSPAQHVTAGSVNSIPQEQTSENKRQRKDLFHTSESSLFAVSDSGETNIDMDNSLVVTEL